MREGSGVYRAPGFHVWVEEDDPIWHGAAIDHVELAISHKAEVIGNAPGQVGDGGQELPLFGLIWTEKNSLWVHSESFYDIFQWLLDQSMAGGE